MKCGVTGFLFQVPGDIEVQKLLFCFAAAAVCLGLSCPGAWAGSLVARVDLSAQTMTVSQDGVVEYRWRVSTARRGYHTPVGRYRAKWLSRYHRSKKYDDAPMPYAIFFKGGYAVHGTDAIRRLGRPASHGCIRLHPANAAILFEMVREEGLRNSEIVVIP